jgi:V8-like Glu-specific endopeptidase
MFSFTKNTLMRMTKIAMLTRLSALSFLFVGVVALTLIGSLSFGVSAQRQGRPGSEQTPVVSPLDRNDPRAQLGPEWRNALPMPFPVGAAPGTAADNPLAAAEAAFDTQTGEEKLADTPPADTRPDEMNEAPPVFPANLGPNAEIDSRDIQTNERIDAARRAGLDPYSVIGTDNRVRISPTTSFPWRAMTKLRMTFPNGLQYICSGALVAAKYTLTAGHCVYSHNDGGWARTIEVIPGLDGTYKPYGSAWAAYMRTYQAWTQNRDLNHDFALITLDRTIGNSTGWLGYASYSTVNGLTGHLAGYPGDRDGGLRLYYHYGAINSSTADRVYYTIDVAGGQSGSGVYRIVNSSRYIFAVNTHEYGTYNGGTRITSGRFYDLQSWIASGY